MPAHLQHAALPPRKSKARSVLEKYLRDRGLRLTRQREVILEAFLSTPRHMSAEELYDKVRVEVSGVGFATVYRTLKLLTRCGLADERRFEGGRSCYEPAAGEHHDHCICTECGKILEFENPDIEALQEEAARRLGFQLTHHRMELYGLCAECSKPAATRSRR